MRCWPGTSIVLSRRSDTVTSRPLKSRVDQGRRRLRPATAADIPVLFAVRTSVNENHLDLEQLAERGVTTESIAAMLADDDMRTWVVEDRAEIVGFAMADARTGTVYALFVKAGADGRGHGRTLLQACEDFLFNAGWETIWLQTGKDPHIRAHGFYRAAGWHLVGPSDHDDVRYEKHRQEAGDPART